MSIRQQLDLDLKAMPSSVQESALAAGARTLADAMDGSESLRDLASALKELRATMETLQSRADQAPSEVDPIDRIESAGQSATVVPIGSRRSG